VANDDVVTVGERVVTSGMDKIFPRDLPIGTIVEIKAGNPFKTIRVRPSANLARLEEVIVLLGLKPLELKQTPPEPAKSSSGENKGAAPAAGNPATATPAAVNPKTAAVKPQ
jgi:rod shape-determining protein MreC